MAKSCRYTVIALSAAFALYIVCVTFLPALFTDLLAPVCDFYAAGLVFYAIHTSKNKEFRLNFIIAGLALLSWALADLGWLIYAQALGIDPDSIGLITALYFGTNLFLVILTIHYLVYRLQKWDKVQLIIDAVTFSLAMLWLMWVLLLNKDTGSIGPLLDDTVTGSASIILDVFQLTAVTIWYLSIRKGVIPVFLGLLAGAVFSYSLLDLVYYYLYAHDMYVPNSYIDALYLLTLFGIAVSVKMYYVKYPVSYNNANQNTNIGRRHKSLWLILFALLIMVFKGIDAYDVIFYLILLLFHEGSSTYIQNTLRNKELLAQEVTINKKLEMLVSEKTNDLKAANDELWQRNEDLRYINLHDPLTGLNNRIYFLDRLENAIKNAQPNGKLALVLWNVDNLKGINDTYGHFTGDKILIQHAGRVKILLGGTGILARLGGDEFAFVLAGEFEDEAPLRIAEQVVHSCKEPFQVSGYTFHVTVGAGISLYPQCSSDRSALLKNADIAMHYAKETKPKSRISMYRDINTYMARKYTIGSSLKTADYDRDLRLHFQPQFQMSDRKLVGMEALLRWDCPGIGSVSPAEFIPIAEEENLIIPIGNWVIENAVSRIVAWNRAHHASLRMGINISPKQFDQFATFEVLDAAIKRHRAQTKWIDIEITEGVALDNEDSAGNIKRYFKNKGISVSIDDFGTGYSSLGYLTILSFDRLKIAKPLIDKITTDESSRKIVTSIILLAKSLDLLTISEGVETKKQFDLLLTLGCDQIQGYYLGRPVPPAEFEAMYLQSAVAANIKPVAQSPLSRR